MVHKYVDIESKICYYVIYKFFLLLTSVCRIVNVHLLVP